MGRYARNSIGQYAPVGAAADDLPGGATPTGKKTIDTTAEVDVASYATAQVVDENLTAENIKKDVEVLGITGSYEGGGSSDFSTATVTIVDPDELMEGFYGPVIADGKAEYKFNDDPSNGIPVILYDGGAVVEFDAVEGTIITLSGNVTNDGHQYIVTGDATITLSAH